MRRPVRTGLAVAAMTGGSRLVGQTAANASEDTSSAPVASISTGQHTGVAASGRSGRLAFSGGDVRVPATVGVLALTAGLGLTVLDRRRESQEV